MIKNRSHHLILFIAFILVSFFPLVLAAQETLSLEELLKQPQIREAIQSGRLTLEQVKEAAKAYQQGKISPQQAKQLQEKAKLGTLTPKEIEAAKELIEEKKAAEEKAPGISEKTEKQPEETEPEKAEKKEPEKAAAVSDEDFFKKKDTGDTEESLTIFGHSLFSSATETFSPIKDTPVSDTYIIGPGDEVKVLMWGRIDAEYSLAVDVEGIVNIPKIGPLTVAGLTFSELKALIKQKVEAITGVNASVSLGRLRTIQVFVLGEVARPGVYTISALSTASNALMAAGGPTKLGSLRRVQIKRQGRLISSIDLYDFMLKGDTSKDSRLMPGDVVFIPQVGPMVSVTGNVRRPGIYELYNRKTLQNTLSLAGGLGPKAYNQRIQIERAHQNRFQVVLDISYNELRQKKPIVLKDGDVVRVFAILPLDINAVYLYGNVRRPGKYAYRNGFRVLDVIPDIDSLEKETDYSYALIKRYRPENMEAQLIPFDLGKLLIQREMDQNLALQPLDEIYVFPKSMFEDKQTALVEGQVRKPGQYGIDDMHVKDLILKAGGLTNQAYLAKGELIRTDNKRNRHTLYFNVAAAMAGEPSENLKVRHEDKVIIHSIEEDKWKEFVSIEGEVKEAGQYLLTQGMRLKDLIFKAGRFTRDAYMLEGHLTRTDWRTKDVSVHRFNINKALKNDPKNNLLLKDLDQVVIHSIWEYKEKYTVSVNGLVNNPGQYPYARNMRVKDLILLAGNVKDGAYFDEAELVRYDIVGGRKVETSILPFNLRKALAQDPNSNLTLQPLDVVNIKAIPEWFAKKKSIAIEGEVLFPGIYQIREAECLSSVLERAGGYTENAYLRAAIFTRESVRMLQQERLDEFQKKLEIEIARTSSSEVQKALSKESIETQTKALSGMQLLVEKLKLNKATGRVVTRFMPIGVLKGSTYDLVLKDGDKIYIPSKMTTVNVLGAVYNPTALIWNKARPQLKYYLARVGGPTANAEEKQMYVIRADGSVVSKGETSWFGSSWDNENRRWWFSGGFDDTKLYPGDTLLVPEKLVLPNYLRDVKDITQILYQIAITTGVIFTTLL